MQQKILLRRKYFALRKKNYYEIDKEFFLPLLRFIRLRFKKKRITDPQELTTLPYLTTESFVFSGPEILFDDINNLSDTNFVAP